MTNPANATPAMVENMASLEEAVYTKAEDGSLVVQNVDTSTPASTDGASGETAAAPADTANPAPVAPVEPASVPASTPSLVQTPPAVEVIPGKVPVATATPETKPAEAAPAEAPVVPAPVEGPTEAERLQGLVDYGAAQAEEARRIEQGRADRRASTLQTQIDTSKETTKEQAKQIRELQTTGLSDEDRAVALAKFEQDDERESLNEYRGELVDFHRTVYIDSLSFEFAQYGVTRESLQEIKTPEEMELACERAKSTALGQQLSTNGKTETAPAVAEPASAAEPVPTKPAAPPAPVAAEAQVPAGAVAASDIGGGSAPAETPSFNANTDSKAMQENLDNMAWDTVKLSR